MEKKRHHYVPRAYLRSFCDAQGRVWTYRKDAPEVPTPQKPDGIAVRKFYYSQPIEGGRDNNSLEDFFSEIESKWPQLVERLQHRENVNDALEYITCFMALQHSRVPAIRDAVERIDAERVKSEIRILDAAGQLPKKPEGYEDILDHIEVSIDPHRSIHAMKEAISAFGLIFDQMGFRILLNKTNISLITSDNPIIFFESNNYEDNITPYLFNQKGRAIEIFFPITPNLVICGHSDYRLEFIHKGLCYDELTDTQILKTINRMICKFAYEAVFASDRTHDALVLKHSSKSPVVSVEVERTDSGEVLRFKTIFGTRKRNPKWKN